MLPQKRSNFDSFSHYFTEKESKLRLQFHSKIVQKSSLFAGICIHVNGRTQPPLEQLRTLVLEHGGAFEQYYHSERVTHVLCTHIAHIKWRNGAKEWQRKLTRPQWIVDCVRAGRMLDSKMYRLEEKQSKINLKDDSGIKDNNEIEDSKDEVEEESNDEVIEESNEIDDSNDEMNLLLGLLEDEKDPISDTSEGNILKRTSNSSTNSAVTMTSESPGFLKEFYKNSRLHHLSRWRQEAKHLVAILSKSQVTITTTLQLVMHVDLDCFFVAVSLLKHPEIAPDIPVVVCHGKNEDVSDASSSSDVSSCNYAARSFGIRNGMYLREALKLCPHLQCIQYDFEGYERVMRTFYRVLSNSGGVVEAVSCDEAYLLLPWSPEEAPILAEHLRSTIKRECGIDASTGMGANRLIARLATRRAKPSSQFLVLSGDVDAFMAQQRILDLPGIGRSVLDKLGGFGDENPLVSELLHLDLPMLQSTLGPKIGLKVFQSLRGIDDRPLNGDSVKERKSVGSEVSWGIRFATVGQVKRFVDEICSQVWERLLGESEECMVADEEAKDRDIMSTKDVEISTNTTPSTPIRIPRKVAVKLYRRSPTAGDPKKFLGRGQCDIFHRTRTLPKGLLSLPQMIDEVWLILQELLKQSKAGVEDIRGLGAFLSDFKDDGKGKKDHLDLKDAFHAGKGIDWEVLKELPEDIQAEFLNNMNLGGTNNVLKAPPISNNALKLPFISSNVSPPSNIKQNKVKAPPLNTLTQLWCHREVRQLKALQDRILALPDDSALDKQVLLALPVELQQEILDEEERKRVRQGIRPSEEIIPTPVKGVISNPIRVTDVLRGVSFKGRCNWSQFDLYKEIKESNLSPSFLGEVEELLVELVLKECFKPVSEVIYVLQERQAIVLVEKIKKLVHDFESYYTQTVEVYKIDTLCPYHVPFRGILALLCSELPMEQIYSILQAHLICFSVDDFLNEQVHKLLKHSYSEVVPNQECIGARLFHLIAFAKQIYISKGIVDASVIQRFDNFKFLAKCRFEKYHLSEEGFLYLFAASDELGLLLAEILISSESYEEAVDFLPEISTPSFLQLISDNHEFCSVLARHNPDWIKLHFASCKELLFKDRSIILAFFSVPSLSSFLRQATQRQLLFLAPFMFRDGSFEEVEELLNLSDYCVLSGIFHFFAERPNFAPESSPNILSMFISLRESGRGFYFYHPYNILTRSAYFIALLESGGLEIFNRWLVEDNGQVLLLDAPGFIKYGATLKIYKRQ